MWPDMKFRAIIATASFQQEHILKCFILLFFCPFLSFVSVSENE